MHRRYLSRLSLVAGIAFVSTAAIAARAQTVPADLPVAQAAPTDDQSVYNWQDVPLNQQIPISRAVFDQGGYQLFDTTGETIIVPFVNSNLYVMKFGQTSGGMYFVNDGVAPTLYVPIGGYLENSATPGAKWYPFTQDFVYLQTVYIGPAPGWDAYLAMGWYPDMACYGGYWGYHPYTVGLKFAPMGSLYFSISNTSYHGWHSYKSYYRANTGGRIVLKQAPVFTHYSVVRRGPASFPVARALAGKPGKHFASARAHGSFSGAHAGLVSPASHADTMHSVGGKPGGAFGDRRPSAGGQPTDGKHDVNTHHDGGGQHDAKVAGAHRDGNSGGHGGGDRSSGSGGGHPSGGGDRDAHTGGGGDKKKP